MLSAVDIGIGTSLGVEAEKLLLSNKNINENTVLDSIHRIFVSSPSKLRSSTDIVMACWAGQNRIKSFLLLKRRFRLEFPPP